ncbi:hypothetical protein BHE74_00026323 [Ensete ventricosum]|nr:hypothetical protein BHE74_00026323 [Ensete ventricosum]
MVASKEGRWLGTSQAIGDCSNLRGVTMHLRLLVRPHPSLSLIEERGKATVQDGGNNGCDDRSTESRVEGGGCSPPTGEVLLQETQSQSNRSGHGGSPFVQSGDRMRTRKRNGVAVAKRDAHTGARKRSKCMFWFGWGGG